MAYTINGPVTIGDTGQATTLLGNLFTPNVFTATGDIYYCSTGGTGAVSALPIGTAGQVLTVVAGLPAWANDTNAIDYGFSATKSGTQIILAAAATTPVAIAPWTAAAAPYFDTTSGAWVPASGTFTPGTAGKYHITAMVAFTDTDGSNPGNSGSRTFDLFNTNTTTVLAARTFQPTGNNNLFQTPTICLTLSLLTTDVLELRLSSSTTSGGMTIQATSNTIFSIVRYA